jgi:undecaprenyl-diphosphatase
VSLIVQKYIKSLPILVKMWIIIGLIFSGISLYTLLKLSKGIIEKSPFPFDQNVINAVTSYSSPSMDLFMMFITSMGSKWALGLLLLTSMMWLLLKYKNFWGMLFYLITVAVGGILNLLLKGFFERERPNVNRIIEADGFSFPSGHSMGSMIYYGFLGYLVIRSKRKPISKLGWGFLFIIVIFLIGVSRIYLGVHYPSDILAGYTAGCIWLILCISLLEIMYILERKRNNYR